MGKWKNIHSEAPSGNITIESWYNADKNALLFLRDNAATTFGVFTCVEDVVENNTDFALAEVCYGYYTFLWENAEDNETGHDDFLDDCWERSAHFTGVEHQFSCHDNLGECEDAYHAIQVKLENEDCDGCDICTEYRVSVPEALA
jgi:hypothetical protein